MHQVADRPKIRLILGTVLLDPRLQQGMHMIRHHAHCEKIIALLIEMTKSVEYDRSGGGRKNAAVSRGKCHMINSVRALVVWKAALRVLRATGRSIRQDAGCSPLEAGAPRRTARVHHSRNLALE